MIIRRRPKGGSNDLNVIYRPCMVEELLGNDLNKKTLKNALDNDTVFHTGLFTGHTGCGKTTAAKVLALGLNCERNGVSSTPCLECATCLSILNESNIDVKEINVGQTGGKDYTDTIVRDLSSSPFNSRVKVIIFDEAHKLTDAAKDLLLKPMETGYAHVYFIFCTNQPEKLLSKKKDVGEAFLDRCHKLNFNRVKTSLIKQLIINVCEFEGANYNEDVLAFVAEESAGVPRDALVWLSQIIMEGSWSIEIAKEICGILIEEDDPKVIEVCRSLRQAVIGFTALKNVNVESIRITVTGYFVACLKRSQKVSEARRYSAMLDVLTVPIYEAGKIAEHKWYNYMFKVTDMVTTPF